MIRYTLLALIAIGLVCSASAQALALVNATTACSTTTNTACIYTLNVSPSLSFTSDATETTTNRMICVSDLGATFTRIPNPVLSVAFVENVTQTLALPASCECESIVWYIEDAVISFSNENINAVLNTCGVCGAAVGNTACNGPAEDLCYGPSVCMAGECVRADKCAPSSGCMVKGCASPTIGCNVETPKCDDKQDICLVGECNPLDFECTYTAVDTTVIPGCKFEVGGIVETINTLSDTSDIHVEFETSVNIEAFTSSGGVTTTTTSDAVFSADGKLEDETIHETSDSSYKKGGLTTSNIVAVMLGVPAAAVTAAAFMVSLMFATTTY